MNAQDLITDAAFFRQRVAVHQKARRRARAVRTLATIDSRIASAEFHLMNAINELAFLQTDANVTFTRGAGFAAEYAGRDCPLCGERITGIMPIRVTRTAGVVTIVHHICNDAKWDL